MRDAPFAPLTAGMVRRASPPVWAEEAPSSEQEQEPPPAGWRDDLRLFAGTWAAGFVFFVVFLA